VYLFYCACGWLQIDDPIRKTYVIDGTKDVTKEELLELIKAIDARLKNIELQVQRAHIKRARI
jgi:hypothetical protein